MFKIQLYEINSVGMFINTEYIEIHKCTVKTMCQALNCKANMFDKNGNLKIKVIILYNLARID
jgi:hypothetical protein